MSLLILVGYPAALVATPPRSNPACAWAAAVCMRSAAEFERTAKLDEPSLLLRVV